MANWWTVTWHRSRGYIFMIPGLVAIILIILYSPAFGAYQQLVILLCVIAVFGVIGGVIAIGTIKHWKETILVLDVPQLEESLDLPIINAPVDDSTNIGRDRWEKPLRLIYPQGFRELFPEAPSQVDVVYLKTWGKFHERAHFAWGLAFVDGFPIISGHIERVTAYPSASYVSTDATGIHARAIFEGVFFRNGDYDMRSIPVINMLEWFIWKEIKRARDDKEARDDRTPVDNIAVARTVVTQLFAERSLAQPEEAAPRALPEASPRPPGSPGDTRIIPQGGYTAYCMKCKAMRELKDHVLARTKSGKTAVKGTCSACGTKMFKLLGGAKK
ncbi:MAG: hypothetical protein KGO96_13070 [Elusimicrobia bacterium]|nr:hypothetical protein [Elusimicrobiota bacterium]MDE2426825.1 hypothetical protein [Elusimicrobiota bacterium]